MEIPAAKNAILKMCHTSGLKIFRGSANLSLELFIKVLLIEDGVYMVEVELRQIR